MRSIGITLGPIIKLSLTYDVESNSVKISFNFHHKLENCEQIGEYSNKILEYKKMAIDILNEYYDLDIEEED